MITNEMLFQIVNILSSNDLRIEYNEYTDGTTDFNIIDDHDKGILYQIADINELHSALLGVDAGLELAEKRQ